MYRATAYVTTEVSIALCLTTGLVKIVQHFFANDKKVKVPTRYSVSRTYQARVQKRFKILEVAAEWHELMIPQRKLCGHPLPTRQQTVGAALQLADILAPKSPVGLPATTHFSSRPTKRFFLHVFDVCPLTKCTQGPLYILRMIVHDFRV